MNYSENDFMRIKRRLTDLYNHITLADRYSVLRRYGLLENAVINYSGGITSLELRVKKALTRSETLGKELRFFVSKPVRHSREEEVLQLSGDVNSELTLLLRDIHTYLRDVRKCLVQGDDENK
ncbi:hypothetical protein ACU605_25235 [Klebsiella aerogenes]